MTTWIPAFAGMTKIIAKITPLIRLPSMVDVFDYFIPPDLEDKIKIGQMVSIPWRARYVSGVVLDIENPPLAKGGQGGFRARPIKKIIDKTPILTSAQLALMQKFSDYYFVAPGSVARLIAPLKPARIVILERKDAKHPEAIESQNISFQIAKSQLPLLEETILSFLRPLVPAKAGKESSEKTNGVYYLQTQDISSFVWFVFYLIKNGFRLPDVHRDRLGRNDKGAVLLLLPTINLINIFSNALKKYQAQMAVIHSKLALGAYWQEYQKIFLGQARIILATRQGAFLPIPNNSTIIMFDSGSADFKQYDQHPRYDARLISQWTAALTKSRLIFAAPTFFPRPDNNSFSLPPARDGQKTIIKLIDMKQNLQSPEFSIISDEVIDEIREAQTASKKTIIIALREQADKGVSVNKINDVLTKFFKNAITVIPTDPAASERPGSGGIPYTKVNQGQGIPPLRPATRDFGRDDIVVATPHLLESGQLLPYRGQIACLVLASIEPLLALPDFRAGERAFYRLKHWELMAQELGIQKIILQSYSPENSVVRAFAYNEVEHFFSAEMETRKRFDYPPFSQLIKLTYQGKDDNEINRVAILLKSRADDNLTVRGPYQTHKSSSQGGAGLKSGANPQPERQSILLKMPLRHPELASGSDNNIFSFLRTLSSGWAIDRDPENVL